MRTPIRTSMRWSWLARAGRTLGAALLLIGMFTAAVHSHSDAAGERGCVVCALAHSSADTPGVVAVPAARNVVRRAEFTERTAAPTFAPRRTESSRAPPLT